MAEKQQGWVCRVCGQSYEGVEAGSRCPEHPNSVLIPAGMHKRFKDDRVLGRVIAGKYAAFSVLGMGGFGAVYRAVQEPVGRHVAIKVVHAHNASDPQLRARFFREARLVAKLKDPVVVTLFDYGEEGDMGLYMVFELVEGRTLNRVIKQGPQEPAWVAHILIQLLRALGEAHRKGMVHRDLKPGNVMVVGDKPGTESVRLLDFGIAKVSAVDTNNQDASLETQRGMVMGTPLYLSPEQAKAQKEIDGRSDIYSLGVLGYSLLEGKNPFERGSMIETVMAHCNTMPPPLPEALQIPRSMEAALMKAMAKDPADRFAAAEEMSAALQASLPHIAFPSLSYELKAPSLLAAEGIEIDGAATPGQTPSGRELSLVGPPATADQPFASSAVSSAPQSSPAAAVALAEPLEAPVDPGPAVEDVNPSSPSATWAGTLGAPAEESGVGPKKVMAMLGIMLAIGMGIGVWLFGVRGTETPEPVPLAPTGRTAKPPALKPVEKKSPEPKTVEKPATPAKDSAAAAAEQAQPAAKTEPVEAKKAPETAAPAKVKTKPAPAKATKPAVRRPSKPAPKPTKPKSDSLNVPEF